MKLKPPPLSIFLLMYAADFIYQTRKKGKTFTIKTFHLIQSVRQRCNLSLAHISLLSDELSAYLVKILLIPIITELSNWPNWI